MSLAASIQKSTLAQIVSRWIFQSIGWRTSVIHPGTARFVMIGAPHTSNWDFFLMLLMMSAERIPIRWLGKDTLFKWPLGALMRSLGAIPVNRRESTRLVDQIAALFAEKDDLIIGISPEGTRKRTAHWRTGFYYIALKAEVPIVMAYIDYQHKVCGLGPSFKPSGDIHADFELIREFYTGIMGKYPHKQGAIEIKDR
ncbi:MAG: lysophospholipid acyltransferase family protein [Anaerolineales bacterium]|nr:lysophospholipid acyltransferase family protein [Anaerolineales bacterium]